MLFFFIWLCPHYKILEFSTTAPVFTSTIWFATEIMVIRHLYIGLRVHYKYYRKKHSRFGFAWSCPGADRGLSWPTGVFRKTIGVQNFIQIG